jgi:hypothetical protein
VDLCTEARHAHEQSLGHAEELEYFVYIRAVDRAKNQPIGLPPLTRRFLSGLFIGVAVGIMIGRLIEAFF